MKNLDGIKESNVLWRIDFLGESGSPMYSCTLDDAHKVALTMVSKKAYIITKINGDRLQQEVSSGKI